jgi:hypothetical protein
MVYLIVLVLLVGTVWVVGGPLLRGRPDGAGPDDGTANLAELDRGERRIDLEAARDAKYRELRDAELDHQTGKLSDGDFRAIDSTLRAEALELLRALDALNVEQGHGEESGGDAEDSERHGEESEGDAEASERDAEDSERDAQGGTE